MTKATFPVPSSIKITKKTSPVTSTPSPTENPQTGKNPIRRGRKSSKVTETAPIISEDFGNEKTSSNRKKRKTKAQNEIPEKVPRVNSSSDIESMNSDHFKNLSYFPEDFRSATQRLTELEKLCQSCITQMSKLKKT